ncbi:MAG: Hpt domain-containing protein [Pseudomonadota bacterium]
MTRISELKEEVGEDDFAEVIGIFFEEVEEVLEELPTSNGERLAEKLHFLKGSALNLGLDAVGNLCRDAETRLRSDPSNLPNIAEILAIYEASKAQLAQ